ncbi:MAG: protein kinase [Sandaracinaceae bacterium]|nr:protein kinase [Sandaracinaceae bacterium]
MARALTILCVDDERMVLVALREQLQRHLGDAAFVETADDGESALEVLEEILEDGGVVPLMITDHIMPGIKGDELVARVHARSPDTRNVMLTGQATADAVGYAVNTGGLYRFLAKPWNPDDLMLTVREALRSFEQERAVIAQREELRTAHEAALQLTASLAAPDRYVRLLERLTPLVGARHAAVLRDRGGRWVPLAITGPDRDRPEPPAAAIGAWGRVARATAPERSADPAASAWLFGDDACRSCVSVQLRAGDGVLGLLVFGSDAPGAFDEVSDAPILGASALAAAALQTSELVDALEESNARRQRVAQELVRQASAAMAGVLLGESDAAVALRARISRVADAPPEDRVLLVGPAGSGREGLARAIHAESPRGDRPFIPLTSALVRAPADVLEKVELARGGTLYLHGVERLSGAAGQALRVALDGPSGEELDVRLIASASGTAELPRDVEAWHSDEVVMVPALRDRAEDVGAMSKLFLEMQGHRMGRPDLVLSSASVARLEQYPWPGNLRELMNVLERAALRTSGTVVEVDDALLETGASVGSYTLIEKLGAGGMGEVWRASHQHLARPAAVKLIQGIESRGFGATAIQRFRREAEATARLRSPHTVELYDFGLTEEGGFYYVMELLEGMDLQDLVSREGPLPPERVIYLVAQVLRSLTEAHELGLVHRDIKPANVFVSQLGAEADFVKVLDFGLVTPVGLDDDAISERDGVSGTPAYMAPEHASEGEVDGRSDLYSLGCVAFWMLTGERVFTMVNPGALIVAQMRAVPDRPSARLGAPLPEGLDEWVLSLLAKAPEDRPASARDAHQALLAIPLESPWTLQRADAWWADHPGPHRPAGSELPPTRSARPPSRRP